MKEKAKQLCRYIDLGLPSGNLWCDRNLGAETPEDSGRYYSYGDTVGCAKEDIGTKRKFDESEYVERGQQQNMIQAIVYDYEDNSSLSLKPEYDAAYQEDNTTCMPTIDDICEIFNYTDLFLVVEYKDGSRHEVPCEDRMKLKYDDLWDWGGKYRDEVLEIISRVVGMRFVGHNGNSILIPAVGHAEDNELTYFGMGGGILSSDSYCGGYGDACYFDMMSYSQSADSEDSFHNFIGMPIRSIKKKRSDEYVMVDLGLSSGLLWANKNIGARKETDPGRYFFFGSVEGYSPEQVGKRWNFTKEEYNRFVAHNPNMIFRAEFEEDDDFLGREYNAGCEINMLTFMPTHEDFANLIEETIQLLIVKYDDGSTDEIPFKETEDGCREWDWTDKNVKKQNYICLGVKFIGTNGNHIFIPAVGKIINGHLILEGDECNLWSSIPYQGSNYAYKLTADGAAMAVSYDNAYCGLPIRMVSDKIDFKL